MRPAGHPFPPSHALATVLVGLLVACSPAPSPPPSPPASASPSVARPSESDAPPGLPAGVIVDPGLLEVLPTEIDGVALEADPTTAAQIASDILLAEAALSLAVALAFAPGASGSDDLAVASVIRLRPDVYDEAFFREWRDTYNAAACEAADGVESEIRREIGGRATYVGACVGGAQTYHVHLEDQGFIVSVTAAGQRRFGELVVAGLAQ